MTTLPNVFLADPTRPVTDQRRSRRFLALFPNAWLDRLLALYIFEHYEFPNADNAIEVINRNGSTFDQVLDALGEDRNAEEFLWVYIAKQTGDPNVHLNTY